MRKNIVKALFAIFFFVALISTSYAGMIAVLVCDGCGYESEELFLGTGKMGGANHVAAYCLNCDTIIKVDTEEERSHWVCPHCGAGEERIYINGDVVDGEEFHLHCPKCGSTDLDIQRVGLWD